MAFLPGLTADHSLFDAQVDYFSGKVNFVVWDPPSHGESRPFELTWSVDDMAGMVRDILKAEGARDVVFVGQSMGGYVAQAFIDLWPEEVAGFVCIDSASLQRRYMADWEIWALRHTRGMYLAIPWGLLKAWAGGGCSTTEVGKAGMRRMMEGYGKVEYCDLAAHGYRALADAVAADRPYQITCPALMLCGTKDAAGSAKAYNRRWESEGGVHLEWVEGAGHNSNVDAPEFVNARIEGFLAGLG